MNKLKINKVSIVIPAWNEYRNLIEIRPRIEKVVSSLVERYEFEFIVIDNNSVDETPGLMHSFCADNSQWKYIRFSRNFGLEASFSQGVDIADGDALIFLFSDMQDPPERIVDLINKWEEGFDIVYGSIEKRSDGRFLERLGAIITHKLLNRLSGKVIPENAADFQLISRPVIEALKLCKEKNRYMRGLVHSLGFKKSKVSFERAPRKHGKTTMDLMYRVNYALTSITAFSSKPLLLISIFGFFLTIVSFLGGVLYLVSKMLSFYGVILLPIPPAGWTTLILSLLFFNGITMLFLGIIGKYVSNIYVEVKERPISIIESSIGFDK